MSSLRPREARRPRLLAALSLLAAVAVVALLLAWDRALPGLAQASGPGPAMSLAAPGTVFVGEPFTVTVSANPAPNVEFVGFSSEVLFPVGLQWLQRPSCLDEVQVARTDGLPLAVCLSVVTTPLGGAGHTLFAALGGAPFHPPFDVVPGSITTLLELDFACDTAGSYTLTLTAVPDSLFGSAFIDTNSVPLFAKTTEEYDYDGDTVPNQVADTIVIDCVVHLGDVDCSSVVSIADAQLIAQMIAGLLSELDCPDNADVDGSGGVDITDAQLIAQLIVGRIDSLPGS